MITIILRTIPISDLFFLQIASGNSSGYDLSSLQVVMPAGAQVLYTYQKNRN